MSFAMKILTVTILFFGVIFLTAIHVLILDSFEHLILRKNQFFTFSKKQPNIILVVADDYGWNDIGYHGSEIRTPTLDKLASEGVKLENYYVQPVCTPSRSQLMTGRYQIRTGLQHYVISPLVPNGLPLKFPTIADKLKQIRTGLQHYVISPLVPNGLPLKFPTIADKLKQIRTGLQYYVISPLVPNGLPLEFPTIADKLKQVGYSTHMIGKWHLGFYTKAHLPHNRGFDTFYGHLCGRSGYYNFSLCNCGMCGYDFWENDKPIYNTEGTYSTTLLASRAVGLIAKHDRNKNVMRRLEFNHSSKILNISHVHKYRCQPLFLYLPFRAVHAPLQVPKEYLKQYRHIKNTSRRLYAGMVTCMDEAIKNVTRSLRKRGLWENTVFIFTTDNGGSYNHGGNNWPLRGGKHELWEGGIRGIGFITSPLLNQKVVGTTSRALFDISDWYPTLVNLAKGNLDEPHPLDGVDQWATINGGPISRTELLHNIDPLEKRKGMSRENSPFNTTITSALRYGDWKILTGRPGIGMWIPSPTNEDIKPVVPEATGDNVWLYNITADPLEHHNVAEHHPHVVDKLLKMLKSYEDTAVPCRFPSIDRRADPKLRGGFWGPWL